MATEPLPLPATALEPRFRIFVLGLYEIPASV